MLKNPNNHVMAQCIEDTLKKPNNTSRFCWVCCFGVTLAAFILVANITFAQTEPNTHENPLFGSPPFNLIIQYPDESNSGFRARRKRVFQARLESDLGPQPGESKDELFQRHWDAAVQMAPLNLVQNSNESFEDCLARKAAQLAHYQERITLSPEPNESTIDFVKRLAQAVAATVPQDWITAEISQKPDETAAAFRARRARELAKRRAQQTRFNNLDLSFMLPNSSSSVDITQNPDESDAAFRARKTKAQTNARASRVARFQKSVESPQTHRLRMLENALSNARLIIPYEPDESLKEYQNRRATALTGMFSRINITQAPSESSEAYLERLEEEIRNTAPASWLCPRPEQMPEEGYGDFRTRQTRTFTQWQQNLSLAQRPGEDAVTHQQRLFENAVKESQVYIPYQAEETASEYHTRREQVLMELCSRLPHSPNENESLVLFRGRLVEQIQASIPTQCSQDTPTGIKQNPGESDAAFRARRARALAKQRARNGTDQALAVDPQAPEATSDPESLMGKTLPDLKTLGESCDTPSLAGKALLICFWNMEQRPARRCLMQLAQQTESLAHQGIEPLAIHTGPVDPTRLENWLETYNISIASIILQANIEKTQFAWGVRALPWLILTDQDHQVIADGFPLQELSQKMQSLNPSM